MIEQEKTAIICASLFEKGGKSVKKLAKMRKSLQKLCGNWQKWACFEQEFFTPCAND